jgi:general secretion pathway protein G
MQRKLLRRRRSRGFTLMEVLLVVAILIILAGLATVAITRTYGGARKNAAKLDINTLSQTMDAYYLDIGSYPPTLEGLVTLPDGLANPAKWNGPYLQKGLPVDPWGNQYQYTNEGEHFKIWSNGADGQSGTEDDVSSV